MGDTEAVRGAPGVDLSELTAEERLEWGEFLRSPSRVAAALGTDAVRQEAVATVCVDED